MVSVLTAAAAACCCCCCCCDGSSRQRLPSLLLLLKQNNVLLQCHLQQYLLLLLLQQQEWQKTRGKLLPCVPNRQLTSLGVGLVMQEAGLHELQHTGLHLPLGGTPTSSHIHHPFCSIN